MEKVFLKFLLGDEIGSLVEMLGQHSDRARVALLRSLGHTIQLQGFNGLLVNALRQIGKDYDFNFDVETGDRIVCSELIYVAYTGIGWPTTKTLGRSTISPDQVAAKALPGGPLELVLLYRDGKQVTEQLEVQLAQLLGNKNGMASPIE